MKQNFIRTVAVLLGCAALFAACDDTWLMYDTSQKDKLYFKYEQTQDLDQYLSTEVSFALLDESVKEIKREITVTLIGKVTDHDRAFEIKALHDTTTNYTTGGVKRELFDAVEGEDYTLGQLVIPAGKTEGKIDVTLHRTGKIKEKTASLVLQIGENELFQGVPRNVYRILLADGTPACPVWWYTTATLQWYQYLGKFTQDKYRKLLEFYHGIEKSNPSLYATMVEQFGENIDKKTYTGLNGSQIDIATGFMVNRQNPQKLAWLRYVLCPLFDYYSTNFPDDEIYTTSVPTMGNGWRNPSNQY